MKSLPISCEKYLFDFKEALNELNEILELTKKKGGDPKIEQQVIRLFEITHELALKTIGEYFRQQGRKPFTGSRDATVEAFNENLIDDGEGWLEMIICRIKYNPLYPENYHPILVENIKKRYVYLFENFDRKMKLLLEK